MNESNKPHDPMEDAILRVIQNISEDVQSTKAIISDLEKQKSERDKYLNRILWIAVSIGIICIGGIVWILLIR